MSVNRRWILINSISIVLQLRLSVGSKEVVTGPSHIEAFVGQNIIFMWNTSNNRTIKSAVFGLSKEGMADPQFINVNMLTGMVHHNAELDKRYAGKVDFVGNLEAGRAWFVMKNLEMNDTNEYLARIAVDVDAVKSHTVKLIVKQRRKIVLKKDKYFITTASLLKTTRWNNGTIVKEAKGTKSTLSPEPTSVSVIEIQGKTVNNTDYVNIEKATQFSKVLAGVIGVIIFLLLVSTAVLIKKMCARKKERKIRFLANPPRSPLFPRNESSKKFLDTSVSGIYGTCQEEEEIQSPGNVDFKKMAEVNQEQTVSVYAQIDRSKKRRPGQVVYAEIILGSKTQEEALSSGPVQLPPKYVETQYADIDTNQLEPKCHIDPLYEILNGD